MKKIKYFLCIFIPILLLFSSGTDAKANVIYEDNFNDGDLTNWSVKRNQFFTLPSKPCALGSQPAEWSIQNGKLGIEIDGPSCVTEITPDDFSLDGISDYIYEFDIDVTSIQEDRNYVIRYKDAQNWYGIHFFEHSVYFQKVVNGQGYLLPGHKSGFPFQANTTYHIKNIVEGGMFKIYINDTLVHNLLDNGPTFQGGTIGLQASSGAVRHSKVLFDNIVVRSLDEDEGLNVPYFSQKNPVWTADEYDHISRFAWATTPTMGRYGCATTSMAMVLNFHGLTQLPDGSPLNPQTLNNWLRDQSDGYIGEASINWNAVTRLTRLIAEAQPGKPKLEYQWHDKDEEKAKSEIAANKPVIFRVPGHFVVGKGHNGTTFNINDPFWPDTKLLTEYGNDFKDMRLFQPSHTDLSYFLFSTTPGLNVVLKNSVGEVVSMESFTEGGIQDDEAPNPSTTQPEAAIHQVAKPESGSYTLEVSADSEQVGNAEIFIYDQLANVTEARKTSFQFTQVPTIFQINFGKEGGNTITEVVPPSPTPSPTPTPTPQPEMMGFDDFYFQVQKFYRTREIKKFSTSVHLKVMAKVGYFAPHPKTKYKIAVVIEQQVRKLKPREISNSAKTTLLEMIEEIQDRYKH